MSLLQEDSGLWKMFGSGIGLMRGINKNDDDYHYAHNDHWYP